MGIKISEATPIVNLKDTYMIPIGNVGNDEANATKLGVVSDYIENDLKQKGTFASSDELQGVYSAVGDLTGSIGYIDDKFTQQFITVGEQIADLEEAVSGGTSTETTTEKWTFELESGETITKEILLKK